MSSRAILKGFFIRGAKPTAGQFAALIDSFWHKDEDLVPVNKIAGLSAALAGKASTEDINNEETTRATADDDLQAQIDALAGGGFDMTAYITAAPVYDNEAAAIAGGLANYTFYKTSTGELRYKLPTVEPITPEPPTVGIVDDTADTFTYTGGEA